MEVPRYFSVPALGALIAGSNFLATHVVKASQSRRDRIKANLKDCLFLMNELYVGLEDARHFLDKEMDLYVQHHPKRLREFNRLLDLPSKEWDGPYWLAESCKGSYALFPHLFGGSEGVGAPRLTILKDKDSVEGNPWKAVYVQARIRLTWDSILQDIEDSKFLGLKGYFGGNLTDAEKALAGQSIALCAPICAMHYLYNHTQEQCYGDPAALVAHDHQKLLIHGDGEICKWRTYWEVAQLSSDPSIFQTAASNIEQVFGVTVPNGSELRRKHASVRVS